MKKSSIALLSAAVLAVLYPGAAWVTGKLLETKLTETMAQENLPLNMKLVKQSYQRGFFSSVQESTLEIRRPSSAVNLVASAPADSAAQLVASASPIIAPAQTYQFQLIQHIQHGPLPVFFGIAAGKIDTEIVLDDATQAKLKQFFGDKAFVDIHSVLRYTGSGSVTISSPALVTVVGADRSQLDWKGAQLQIAFNAHYDKLSFDFLAPGLSYSGDADKNHALQFEQVKMSGELERAFPEGKLYLGDTTGSIATLNASGSQPEQKILSMKNLTLESHATLKDNLVDIDVKSGVGSLQLDSLLLNNLHYDYSVNRLHGETLNSIITDMAQQNRTLNKDAQWRALSAIWHKYGLDLLKYDPVLALQRLSFSGKSGDANIAARFSLPGVTAADMDIGHLVSKVDSTVNVNVAQPLLLDLFSNDTGSVNGRDMMSQILDEQVASFENRGYLQRKGNDLTSQLVWKQGKLLVNGKPLTGLPGLPH